MDHITVLVADGQRLFAQALSLALQHFNGLEVVGPHPEDGLKVLDATRRYRPDVVVLDYWMPGMSGPAAARLISDSLPDTRVLLLSWVHGPAQVQEAMAAGAAGFIPKSVHLAELAEAIRRAQRGDSLVFGPELANLVEAIDRRSDEAEERAKRLRTLTPREIEVLQLMCDGRPAKVVAAEMSISIGTLRNHIHRILAKIGAESQLEAVSMARQEGVIREIGPPGTFRNTGG